MPDGVALIRPTGATFVGRIRRLRRHPAGKIKKPRHSSCRGFLLY
ncbi:hypothetical protein HMPREF0208_03982 [Citrobacter koseri]|nr:hypothetical protein HMPREF3220_02379 [Citrobacter koseri]KWZ99194.1 hypothetical protein HMPREF3207_03948 [Citrobacter koseri]KXB40956.1 hypothetical protein HMPREF0208_03982 [Citrobacter koseri]